MKCLLSLVALALLVSVCAIPPHTAQLGGGSSRELPPTTSGQRDAIGDVASVIQEIGGATTPTSTTSATPPATCPSPTPSPSPFQPLVNWWTAFLTSATTFMHPVGVFIVWLVAAASFGFGMWFAFGTCQTMLEIWSDWLKIWFSPGCREARVRETRAPEICSVTTQTVGRQERSTQTEGL
ncbi:hypothetical protein K488DRAFT_73234 [Vararia minispora EC-137]|uniref:Uncharacterized protein n=1 Tax=Vararia minispora EC-137 TaxID=1314806 RepID=A0ACB8QBX0_9AGAM|nr:hypothetical protein K488DRAFT_73234 [Vararia minispora EC-137]